MKKYRLAGFVTVSAMATVEAESPEEALRKSRDFDATISNGCRFQDDEIWIVSEVDGDVFDARIEGEDNA